MKKNYFKALAALTVSAIFFAFACNKMESEPENGENSTVKVGSLNSSNIKEAIAHSDAIIDVRVTKMIQEEKRIVNKIEIINKRKKATVGVYFAELTSKKNIRQQLENGELNGSAFIRDHKSNVVEEFTLNGGKIERRIIKNGLGTRSAGAEAECSFWTVHECVANEINGMNPIDYGVCLFTAPACYAQLWASCTWDTCFDAG